MGVYSEYLDRQMGAQELAAERKAMLGRISEIRKRDVLVYAADIGKASQGAPVGLTYDDLLIVKDQLENLKGEKLDFILETGGGSGEVAEDIVRILRAKYGSVAFIVPGIAKSAGTIMVMSGNEILMDAGSALGPIDAQIQFEGKQFSAEALLKGFDKIKEESDASKSLNRAYIPLLQRISPGDLQHAQNALEFAKRLVANWLKTYKFANWSEHRTHNPGTPVTDAEKEARAAEIANQLCDHSRWLTHGRSIRMEDLRGLGLEIIDFSLDPALRDAVNRYHVLQQMLFGTTNAYKMVETPSSQVMRHFQPAGLQILGRGLQPVSPVGVPPGLPQGLPVGGAMVAIRCGKCAKSHNLQADFDKIRPLQPGAERFPANDVLVCDQCGNQINVFAARQQIETQTRRKVAKA